MKLPVLCPITLGMGLVLLDAGAMNSLAQLTAPSTAPVLTQTTEQMQSSDRMFYWNEESRELHAMATNREREAELLLKKYPGPATDEFVKQMRLLVHKLHEAAEYADTQAKEAERDISLDIIQQLHSTLR